jgi:hypothetical protein
MITQQQAQEMLDQVEQTERRSQQFLGYWQYGVYAQVWGVVWIVAYLTTFFFPGHNGATWGICNAFGGLTTLILRVREGADGRGGNRETWAILIIVLFGAMASILIGARPKALEVFWTCLIMTGYMLSGLWTGLRWTILGAAVCAMSLFTYWFLMPWFELVMAIAGGGGLLLGGTWMRRAI